MGLIQTLETRAPTLFLVSGVLVLGFAGSFVVEVVTTVDAPEGLFGGAGFTIGFIGLLGLYPTVADRRPTTAGVGALFAALGALGFAVTFLTGLTALVQVTVPGWLSSLVVLNILGLFIGFSAFGVAVLRTGVWPSSLGWLLLAPPAIFAVNFVRVLARGGPGSEAILPEVSAVLAFGQAVSLLAIGYTLRTTPAPAETASSHDSLA